MSADPDLFFPISATGPALGQVAQAKAVCEGCQVQQDCLDFAMTTEQTHGVWGGTTGEERQRLRRQRRRAARRQGSPWHGPATSSPATSSPATSSPATSSAGAAARAPAAGRRHPPSAPREAAVRTRGPVRPGR
jgi:WhiB family redox-sensing transcriptional regulator